MICKNGLTLLILKWYEWLRFKDIVQGFGKLEKMLWNGMVQRIKTVEKNEKNRM